MFEYWNEHLENAESSWNEDQGQFILQNQWFVYVNTCSLFEWYWFNFSSNFHIGNQFSTVCWMIDSNFFSNYICIQNFCVNLLAAHAHFRKYYILRLIYAINISYTRWHKRNIRFIFFLFSIDDIFRLLYYSFFDSIVIFSNLTSNFPLHCRELLKIR